MEDHAEGKAAELKDFCEERKKDVLDQAHWGRPAWSKIGIMKWQSQEVSRREASTVALKNACGGAAEPTGLSDGIREEFETLERAWRSDEEGTH